MKINNIKIIKESIISFFKKLKNSNQLEIQYIKTFLNIEHFEEQYNTKFKNFAYLNQIE